MGNSRPCPSDGTPIQHAEVEAVAREYAQRRRVQAALDKPRPDDDSYAGEPIPPIADSVLDSVVISPRQSPDLFPGRRTRSAEIIGRDLTISRH